MTSERFSGLKTSAIGKIKAEKLKTEMLKSGISRNFRHFLLFSYQIFWFSLRVLLAAVIERLYDLNVGTTPVQEGAPMVVLAEG